MLSELNGGFISTEEYRDIPVLLAGVRPVAMTGGAQCASGVQQDRVSWEVSPLQDGLRDYLQQDVVRPLLCLLFLLFC